MKKYLQYVIFLTALTTSCSKDTSTLDFFIPNLSNAWINTSNSDDQYFFLNATDSVNKSNFDGNENLNGEFFHFEGSFENTAIEFTFIDGPRKDVQFKGSFDPKSDPLRMTVRSNTETMTLVRQ